MKKFVSQHILGEASSSSSSSQEDLYQSINQGSEAGSDISEPEVSGFDTEKMDEFKKKHKSVSTMLTNAVNAFEKANTPPVLLPGLNAAFDQLTNMWSKYENLCQEIFEAATGDDPATDPLTSAFYTKFRERSDQMLELKAQFSSHQSTGVNLNGASANVDQLSTYMKLPTSRIPFFDGETVLNIISFKLYLIN